jgi:hypothetical protein
MEDFDIASGWETTEASGSPEAIREKSEKQKESYKKAQAQIQKSQKDEKKAKWDNDELFHILSRFIQNPYYESLVPSLTELLTIALPSRPIIGLLALIYPDASHYVLHAIGQWERIHLLKVLHRYDLPWNFHERDLHESIRQWMSLWIDSLDRYIVSDGASVMMQKKFIYMIENQEILVLKWISDFVFFFFESRNIIISLSTTESYAHFILKNIHTTLQKSLLSHPDKDIINEEIVSESNLFWL